MFLNYRHPLLHRSLPPLEAGGGERLSTIPFLRKETEGREWKNNCLWWVDGPVGSWTEPKLNSEIMRLIRTICLLRSRLLSATQRCPAGGVALRDILKNGSKVRLMLQNSVCYHSFLKFKELCNFSLSHDVGNFDDWFTNILLWHTGLAFLSVMKTSWRSKQAESRTRLRNTYQK